jgi:hypothetical protein
MSIFFTFFIIIFIMGLLITLSLKPNPPGKTAAGKKALTAGKTGKKPQALPVGKPRLAHAKAAAPKTPPENKGPTKDEVRIRVKSYAIHYPKETARILSGWIRGGGRKKTRR